jgi:ATP-dependent RNA helicase RhlE
MSFDSLGLSEPLVRAVHELGYTSPTPIQLQAIPAVLNGGDLLAGAQTGTGKTAGFTLPILQRLNTMPPVTTAAGKRVVRALILTPTRELAAQVEESVRAYGKYLKLKSTVMFGGVGINPQIDALRRGIDIVVATPGRLLDHMQQKTIDLSHLEILVLDEADRMLDMGFIHDIRRIVAQLPAARQTLFFSATMPEQIAELAKKMLRDPVRVAVTPAATTVERVEQRVIHVERGAKAGMLADLLRDEAVDRALVFTRTKHGADKVVRGLVKAGIGAHAIHGNKSQNQRERVLADFRAGKIRTLVATDIAARGIDVDGISHVVQYDLPNEPESYVHRIGRTARAGATGIAISLCSGDEVAYLRAIEKLIRLAIPAEGREPAASHRTSDGRAAQARPNGQRPHGGRGQGGRGNGDRAHGNRGRGNQSNGGHGHGGHGHGGRKENGQAARSGQPRHAASHHGDATKPVAPVYGERAPQNGRPQSAAPEHQQDTQSIGGVGFMRRPVPGRRDDAGRRPR